MYYPISARLIECLILSVVAIEDSYGYEICQHIKNVSDIKESTLYPILKKLEKEQFLTSYTEEHNGRKRKYYAITRSGQVQLTFLREQWMAYRNEIDALVTKERDDE